LNQDIANAQAKCSNCGQIFAPPDLGDFSYGESLFSTVDGKHFAWVSAFSDFPQRVKSCFDKSPIPREAGAFWKVLAALADSVEGQSLSTGLHCGHCGSGNLAFWGGDRVGFASVPEVCFLDASVLDDRALSDKVIGLLSEMRTA